MKPYLFVLVNIISFVSFTVILYFLYHTNPSETFLLSYSPSSSTNATDQNTNQDKILTITANNRLKKKPVNKSGKILVFTIAVGNKWYKSIVRANRDNYCKKNNYSLIFLEHLTVPLGKDLNNNWIKIIEGMRLFNDSAPYEWIFFADLDLFIMNLETKIEGIVKIAVAQKIESVFNRGNVTQSSVEMNTHIILTKDGNGFNFGSVLVRNSNYSKWVFREIWNRRRERNIPHILYWFEQAVFSHLASTLPGLIDHVIVVPQRLMNGYSSSQGMGHYMYKRGDFVIHFPGGMKNHMENYLHQLLEIQPELKKINDARAEQCRIHQINCI
jgi:hypothetical protein